MGSISRSRPFLRINYTVDTCYVVSATKTNFLSCILHLRPSLVDYVTKLTHVWYSSANRSLYGRYLMNTLLGMVYF